MDNYLLKLSQDRKKELYDNRDAIKEQSEIKQAEVELIMQKYMKSIYQWLDSIFPSLKDLQVYAQESGETKYIIYAGKYSNLILNNKLDKSCRHPETLKPFLPEGVIYIVFSGSRALRSDAKPPYILYGKNKNYPISWYNPILSELTISHRHICEYLMKKELDGIKVRFSKKTVDGVFRIYIVYISWGKSSRITWKDERRIRKKLDT